MLKLTQAEDRLRLERLLLKNPDFKVAGIKEFMEYCTRHRVPLEPSADHGVMHSRETVPVLSFRSGYVQGEEKAIPLDDICEVP